MKKLKGIFGKGKGGGGSTQVTGGAGASNTHLGYDLKEKDLPKIHKAAWTGDIAKVKQLAKKDSGSLDKENRTPLHLACANGHAKVVQELLEWNAKTNVGDNEAKTPLMKAVECNQEDCVKLLLEYRTDVDARDGDNNTALHLAIKDSNVHMVAILIENGANTNLKNRQGQTPLILSVLDPSKKDTITRFLLENNAEVNAVDSLHRSALHHACMEDGINQVKLLLEHHASTALKDTKGWTAEDCAMMKANHACSQVVFDHNLKSRRLLGGSVPNTPRSEATNPSRHTTPRDKSTASESGFGMPQEHLEDAEDSDEQTLSKQSLHDNRQDSWADDTDVSAADDKLKEDSDSDVSDMERDMYYMDKGAPVKTSLTKHINIDSDDEDEIEDIENNKHAANNKTETTRRRSPVKFRKVLVSTGDLQPKVRPMYSRTPTPDRDLARSQGSAHSPQARSTPSKIPVKQRLSGASHTSVEEDFTDEEDDSSPVHGIQRGGRVSFSDHQQIRNISATDDDTDVEDDEEEVEPPKKRRIGNPDDNSSSGGYTPTGYQFDPPDSKPLSQDKMKENGENAMMADLGIDDLSDVSDPEDLDESEPKDPVGGSNSQPTTPRGILKKTESSGKPPAVQHAVDTDAYWDSEDDEYPTQERSIVVEAEVHPPTLIDSPRSPIIKDEESDWDSTKQSLTEKGSQSLQIREDVESPEIDSDIENTLNPEKSIISKDPTIVEDLSTMQDSNTGTATLTVEVVQESTTPDNMSGQDSKLANTGEINTLLIGELTESTDFSLQGSGSVAMETLGVVTVIERNPDKESLLATDRTATPGEVIDDFDSDNESGDRGETMQNDGQEMETEVVHDFNDEDEVEDDFEDEQEDKEHVYVNEQKDYENEENIYDSVENIYENSEISQENKENFEEIEGMIDEELNYFEEVEKSEESEKAEQEGLSVKGDNENSTTGSESRARKSGEFKVIARDAAPKVMLDYEPSTTEAEDSDTVDTESIKEDDQPQQKQKKLKKTSNKSASGKSLIRHESMNSDKEVAVALGAESSSTASRHQLSHPNADLQRGSTEPTTTLDTMGEQPSLADDQDEVIETSQWDSSEEAFTPRTPRDSSLAFKHPGLSPDVQEFEYEDESESTRGHDHIQEVMTSFGVRQTVPQSPSLPTPEPHSDSSALRSRDTPDPPTSSYSASNQKTVIAAEVDEPEESPRQHDEENSDWDSEDDVHSEDDEGQEEEDADGSTPVVGVSSPVVGGFDSPVVIGIDSVENTPRTPRTPRGEERSEEESVSEWEIEREKEREAAQKREEEMRILQEMEEEEERQRKWEDEERRRQAQIEQEAQEELERERLASGNAESEESDFSDEDDPLPDSARKPESEHSYGSQHASQRSQLSGASERSQRSESITSPRARELKKLPAKLVVRNFIPPVQSPPGRDDKTPVTMGEIENESPAPDIYDDMIQPTQQHHRFATPSGTPDFQDKTKESGNMYSHTNGEDEESDNDIEEINDEQDDAIPEYTSETHKQQHTFSVEANIEHDVQRKSSGSFVTQDNFDDDEDEFEDGVDAQLIMPQTVNKVEAAVKPATVERSELPVSVQTRNQTANGVLAEPPPLPKTGPPGGKAMSLQSDGQSADEDYLDSHVHLSKPPGPLGLPDLSGTTGLYSSGLEVPFDDDGLSVTSTENGDISSSYRPENLPYGKDMLVNMNLSDSNSILKLQEHLREHRKQLEYERNQKMLLESRQKQMSKDKVDLQKMVDSLKYQKSALEQSKLDLEAKIRNLEYGVSDEEEKKKNAELLLKKTKEQLSKKEEQYTQEMEAKQRAELTMRNIQMELRSAQNVIKDLEEEKGELERQMTNEKNARHLQEKINEEQQRLQQHIQEESMKTSSQREDAYNSLEIADDDIKHARDLVEKYKNEIAALKAELQRQRSRLTEENTMLSSENDKLQQRVDDLKSDIKDHEEALTQMTVQHNLHNSKLVSEATMLSDNLEKERVAREKVEAELDSLRTRLQATTVQYEKAQHARNDFERRLHGDREEWARQLDRKDQELTSLKEKVQVHIAALNSVETKLNAVENELQISNTTLLERTNQYQQAQRDLQYYKTSQENHDINTKHEKEQNAKHVAKIESLQDKLSGIQHENLSLKQQVESAQLMAHDRSGFDLQDKLNTMISSLKSDHEKARASLEDKNNNLQDTITRLREEVRNSENRRSNQEQDIRRMNQEQNEIIRKLSIAEASLDVATKAREHLEQERLSLKMEIEKLQQRYNSAQEKTIEAQTRMGDLVDKLDRTEQSRMLSSQQLADTSATMQQFNVSKSELEENYQKIQVENVRLDAELKHEKQKTDMLQRDLADSQKVRSSLEALCSNLKSTNAHLEEKLGPDQLREVTASGEIVNRNMVQKEAEDHKGLWEQEVLSRSKLGLRIAQLERHKQETATQLEEEKRRTRKALEQKKLAETKLEAEHDKVTNLQKEVANLKAYLKVAKKRLRVLDSNENRLSNLHSAFDKERQAMEDMLVSVKSQLEHMKIQMQDEIEEKDRIHQKNVQLEAELKTIKKLEKSVQKIDRSKKKLEEEFRLYKNSVETGYTEKSTVEEAKKDIEARYRLELNRKLDEVNNYLEEQARTRQRLDLSRDEQESKIRNDKKKFEEECTDLRIKYEQAVAKLDTKDLEAKRYRDLYESEMQWRMRLSEQLYRSTDKAFGFKNNAERQKNRMSGSMTNLSMNGHMLDISKLNGSMADDALSNRLRAELDRSIAKHLEAAPHDQLRPLIRTDDPVLGSSNFAKASADYIEVLKRKYCV